MVRLVHADKDGVTLYATKYSVDKNTNTLTFNDILPNANQSASTVKGEYKVMILVNDSTLQKAVRKKAGQVKVEQGVEVPAKADAFASREFYQIRETIINIFPPEERSVTSMIMGGSAAFSIGALVLFLSWVGFAAPTHFNFGAFPSKGACCNMLLVVTCSCLDLTAVADARVHGVRCTLLGKDQCFADARLHGRLHADIDLGRQQSTAGSHDKRERGRAQRKRKIRLIIAKLNRPTKFAE